MNSSVTTFETEALNRKRAMLRSAFGPVIAAALAEPQVIEVMVNPDGGFLSRCAPDPNDQATTGHRD